MNKYENVPLLSDTQQEQLKSNLERSMDASPDQAAKASIESQRSGLPFEVVERNLPKIEKSNRYQSVRPLIDDSPVTKEFLSTPENAKQSHDDIENLSFLEKIFSGQGRVAGESFAQAARGIMTAGVDAAPDRIDDIVPFTAVPVGMEDIAIQTSRDIAENLGIKSDQELQQAKQEELVHWLEQIHQGDQRIDELTPDDMNIIEEGIRSGITSLMVQGPAFLASLATRSPSIMLGSMSAHVAAESYGQARAQGLPPAEAARFASIEASIEFITEKIPAESLVKLAGGRTGGKVGEEALRFLISEGLGEQLATFGQTVNAYLHGLDEELEQAESLSEQAEIQARRQAVTFFATLTAGGAQSSVAYGVGKASDKLEERRIKSLNDQEKLGEISEASQQASLKERNSRLFKELIQKYGEKYGAEKVYLDAEEGSRYLQEGKLPEETARLIQEQEQAALESGAPIEIPIDVYASEIAGSDIEADLSQYMKIDPDALTPAEMQSDSIEEEIQGLVEQESEQAGQESLVYNDVLGQLLSAGRNRSESEQYAGLWEAAFRTISRKSGVTESATDLYRRYNPYIRQEIPEELKQKARQIEQIDITLDRLRSGDVPSDGDIFGESLLQFIVRQGGILDEGGELAARDVDAGRVGRNRLTRKEGRTLDEAAELAVESGYIEERTEQALLDAIDRELAGDSVYSLGNENRQRQEIARDLEQLNDLLLSYGLDLATMDNEQIKSAILGTEEVAAGDILMNQDFGDMQLSEDLEIEGTGETVSVTRPAQRKFEQAVKRKNVLEQLRDCLNG